MNLSCNLRVRNAFGTDPKERLPVGANTYTKMPRNLVNGERNAERRKLYLLFFALNFLLSSNVNHGTQT
jgi:hypothetical protein